MKESSSRPSDSTPELTRDSLFEGELICYQHRHGYRFSVDAVLLAHFAAPAPADRVLDLGAGCGIVSLLLAYRMPELTITALELQPALADLARKNIEANRLTSAISLLAGDMAQTGKLVPAGSFDLVVSNPPYHKPSAGRQNLSSEKNIARHEIEVDLAGVIDAASVAVRTRGRVVFVYPAARGASLLAAMKGRGLEPKKMQVIYSYPGDHGRLVLVEAMKGGGEEFSILPPFHIYSEAGGEYSAAMAACYRPGNALCDFPPL